MRRSAGGWIGFLASAFLVVGMTGEFATYAAPLPLQRAEQREAAFDAAMQATPGPALEALRPALGEDADAVIAAAGAPPRLFALRAAMRQRFLDEADAIGTRQRWMIGIITLMGALFGALTLGFGRTQNPES